MATNDAWLNLVQEDTLEPDLPICDPHHHLWDQRPDRVEPRYLIDEILADLTIDVDRSSGFRRRCFLSWA
jgi:hypothetical protein